MEFKSEQRIAEMFNDIAESFNTSLSGCTAYVNTTISNNCIINQGSLACSDNIKLNCEARLDCKTKHVVDINVGSCWLYLDNDKETDKDLQVKSKTLISVMTLLTVLPFSYTLEL